jgi:hypothetical protein
MKRWGIVEEVAKVTACVGSDHLHLLQPIL